MCLQGAEAEANLVCELQGGLIWGEDEGEYEEASLDDWPSKLRIKRKSEGTAGAVKERYEERNEIVCLRTEERRDCVLKLKL